MRLPNLDGVEKVRRNIIKVPKDISQKGYTFYLDDSKLPDLKIVDVKNITTRKHVIINDPIQPEVTLVTAPRKARHGN